MRQVPVERRSRHGWRFQLSRPVIGLSSRSTPLRRATVRPSAVLSVAELQAALFAARRGDFAAGHRGGDTGTAWVTGRPMLVGDAAAAGSGVATEVVAARREPVDLGTRVVPVVAAHAGAGASTVALAIAEAAASGGTSVRLLDCGDPARSGLAAVAAAELGVSEAGWRTGRRGTVMVDRLDVPATCPADVIPPHASLTSPDGRHLLVVDVGWPVSAVLAAPGWLAALLTAGPAVAVCRVTVPGVRQVEQALSRIGGPVIVAAVGPARWPGPVAASTGPALAALRRAGRVVSVPVDKRVQITGLTAAALPKAVLAAGRQLAALAESRPPAPRGGVDVAEEPTR